MLKRLLDDFLTEVPLQLPGLLDIQQMGKPVFYDDYVLLLFDVKNPCTIEEMLDTMEDELDMVILYHHIPNISYGFGRSCCAYSNPNFERMFKMNASTNERGLVDHINVTIYDSLEFMCADICVDLKLHAKKLGHFKYERSKEKVLFDFI